MNGSQWVRRVVGALSLLPVAVTFVAASDLAPGGSRSDQQIRAALEQRVDFDLPESTLADLVSFLRERGIPVSVNVRALEDYGIDTNARLDFSQQNLSLRTGLDLALRQVDLTWTIRSGVLILTTPDDAETNLITRLYDVHDLVDVVPQSAWNRYSQVWELVDFNSLIDVITTTIEPDTWDAVGGPASAAPYRNWRMRLLVVSQTWQNHEKIEKLLAELTRLGRRNTLPTPSLDFAPPTPSLGSPTQPVTRLRSSQLRTTGLP
ncbi:MAG: hypothetical protein KDA55_21065 [Planctomycetales bacterium]|nr:hypothetical protein [Planctomycetales bacterium]